MSDSDGPDFICVGMPKAGTGWLYDQLDAHPEFWMPPVKELVYLNQEYPPLGFVTDRGEPARGRRHRQMERKGKVFFGAAERRVHRQTLDARDTGFLKRAGAARGETRSLETYASFFRFKGDLLSGDITPPYCNLGEDLIGQIAARFPNLKVLLLVRDPVARVWSRICMSYEGQGFDTRLLDEPEKFRAYIQRTHKLGGLSAVRVHQNWREHAPGIPFQVIFFDNLVGIPDRVRREVLLFLGADPERKSGDLPPNYNRKAKKKLELTPRARDVLVEYFQGELLASARIFGGPARAWPGLYGL